MNEGDRKMKRMSYTTLMKKISNGQAEVDMWVVTGKYANVSFRKANGTFTREMVEVTNVPANVKS
jgi:hypothetical protein